MFTALLPFLALIGAPSAAPARMSTSTALQVYMSVAREFAGAAGLELDSTFAMTGGDPARVQGMLAKPMAGWLTLEIGGSPVDYVADGRGLHVLNAAFETYTTLAGGLMEAPVVGYISPLQAWASGAVREPLSAEWVESTPKHPLVRVMRVEFPGQHETLWIGPDNGLLACTVKIEDGSMTIEASVTFAKLSLLPDADPATCETPIPEGYSLSTDSGSQLLAVGAEAPDVELTSMDGETFMLSSLKGETVLLNFWFYT